MGSCRGSSLSAVLILSKKARSKSEPFVTNKQSVDTLRYRRVSAGESPTELRLLIGFVEFGFGVKTMFADCWDIQSRLANKIGLFLNIFRRFIS